MSKDASQSTQHNIITQYGIFSQRIMFLKSEISNTPTAAACNCSSRCALCRKKTLLLVKCKCGKEYCVSHRLPEDHQCTYDHRSEGRKILELNNPVVCGEKLRKIEWNAMQIFLQVNIGRPQSRLPFRTTFCKAAAVLCAVLPAARTLYLSKEACASVQDTCGVCRSLAAHIFFCGIFRCRCRAPK